MVTEHDDKRLTWLKEKIQAAVAAGLPTRELSPTGIRSVHPSSSTEMATTGWVPMNLQRRDDGWWSTESSVLTSMQAAPRIFWGDAYFAEKLIVKN